jgi:competence protein ComEA
MRRGITLLMLLLLILLFHRSRDAFPPEGPPAFLLEDFSEIALYLGEGFSTPGLHQFSDGTTLSRVIELTMPGTQVQFCQGSTLEEPLRSGELLEFFDKDRISSCLRRSWMPAGVRLALGIRLHPDRMTREDWEVLPGIGPRLSERIEMDRQLNGDFGGYRRLERVRGIGQQRINQWEEFFISE